jgi:hypothetical protein
MTYQAVLNVLANGQRGWSVVLALWAAELATVVSLVAMILYFRARNLELDETWRIVVSLRNSMGRLSREMRKQQDSKQIAGIDLQPTRPSQRRLKGSIAAKEHFSSTRSRRIRATVKRHEENSSVRRYRPRVSGVARQPVQGEILR